MAETSQNQGALGVARSMFRGASKAVKAVSSVAKLDYAAMALVGFAASITMAKKAGIEVPYFAAMLTMALGFGALMFEGSTMAGMVRSFWNGKIGGIFSNGAIWSCAVAFAFLSWIGAAGQNEAEKSDLHKAAFLESASVQESAEMAAKKVLAARQKAEKLNKIAWDAIPVVAGQQITTEAQAMALIDKAKGTTRYWDMTKGCTETTGPKTRQFCAEYRDAVAALSDVQKRAESQALAKEADEEVKEAEAELAAAKSKASTTKVVASEARADLFLLTDWGGVSEKTSEQFVSFFMMAIITIFWSYSWARIELAHCAARGPRRPFGFFHKLRHGCSMLRYFLAGGERPVWEEPSYKAGPTYTSQTNITLAGDDISKKIQELAKEFAERKQVFQ